jgi:hypothetical protein
MELDCIGLGWANCSELDCKFWAVAKFVELHCIGFGGKLCGTELYSFCVGKLSETGPYNFWGGGPIVWTWSV